MSYQWYDAAGRAYQLSQRQVATLVKRHGLTKRKIYGHVAVESNEWDALMEKLGKPLAPGYTKARQERVIQ